MATAAAWSRPGRLRVDVNRVSMLQLSAVGHADSLPIPARCLVARSQVLHVARIACHFKDDRFIRGDEQRAVNRQQRGRAVEECLGKLGRVFGEVLKVEVRIRYYAHIGDARRGLVRRADDVVAHELHFATVPRGPHKLEGQEDADMQVLIGIERAWFSERIEKPAKYGLGSALDVREDAFQAAVELTVEIDAGVEVLDGSGVLDVPQCADPGDAVPNVDLAGSSEALQIAPGDSVMTATDHGFRRRGGPPPLDLIPRTRVRIDEIVRPRTAGSVDPAAVQ